MNTLPATRLRDIQGLDAIPAWPPGLGWWLLLALGVVAVYLLVALVKNVRRYPIGSWRRDAWKRLRALRQQSANMPADQLAGELSSLLRRIAVARFGRDQAASLTGDRWLVWLHKHDPAGFDWARLGKPLLTLPYAPASSHQAGRKQLMPLIDAAFAWTDRKAGRSHV